MAELLLEILSEEMPARMQANAEEQLAANVKKKFAEYNIKDYELQVFSTSTRLILYINNLPIKLADTIIEKKGPLLNNNSKAIEGFRKSNLNNIIEVRPTEKGECLFAVIEQKGQEIKLLLQSLIPEIILSINWPKSMRWGDYTLKWVRPIKNIMCLLAGEILDFNLYHLKSTHYTIGNKFINQTIHNIINFQSYKELLATYDIVIERKARKELIEQQIKAILLENQLTLLEDNELLEEIVGLVESPHVLLGQVDHEFQCLPADVINVVMRSHQKYFTAMDNNKTIFFIVVINKQNNSDFNLIIKGNEKVLRARLADATFFYKIDMQTKLSLREGELNKITFHTKLGTMQDKVLRMVEFAQQALAKYLLNEELRTLFIQAIKISKNDLTTEMVKELPELQGIMGADYAQAQGENPLIANAIKEQYKPIGSNDEMPNSSIGYALALTDKIDSLVGLFIAGERATGSKDPFGLRRSALGIVRILRQQENITKEPIDLEILIKSSILIYTNSLNVIDYDPNIANEIIAFIMDRMKILLKSEGIRYDVINAVLNQIEQYNIVSLVNKIYLVQDFVNNEQNIPFITACKRVLNIVTAEERKDQVDYSKNEIDISLVNENEEKLLLKGLNDLTINLKKDANNYINILTNLGHIIEPINNFFDNIQINHSDLKIRQNRLCILSKIKKIINKIANFSLLES